MSDRPTPTDSALPTSVAAVAAASLQSFLSAAALNLGEATSDGQRLAAPDPLEAWRAILAADALVKRLAPMLPDEAAVAVDRLVKTLAERHPDMTFPVPEALLESEAV